MKNDGRERSSKANKKKHKLKQVKCSCKEITEYQTEDIQNVGKIFYVECSYCGKDIVLK